MLAESLTLHFYTKTVLNDERYRAGYKPAVKPVKAQINIIHNTRLLFSLAKKDKDCPVRLLNTGKNKIASHKDNNNPKMLTITVSIKNW